MHRIGRRATLTNLLSSTLLLMLLALSAAAQSTATLQGTIVDAAGGVLVGAKVTIRNQATGLERTAQTDLSGIYQIAALPVGLYRVEVQVAGFGPQTVSGLRVEVGSTMVQNFQLRVGDVSQNVSVMADGQL